MKILLNDRPISISSQQAIGKGGEADIYDIGNGQVLKLFKQPDHPDYDGQPSQQKAARKRIQEHQQKLLKFPQSVPIELIAPARIAKDANGRILGYSMRHIQEADLLMQYANKSFRTQGVDDNDVTTLFQNLRKAVKKLHKHEIVIGDFNDLNVLVKGTSPYLIDADSYQFGSFPCRVFTQQFADPLHLRKKTEGEKRQNPVGNLVLKEAHSKYSDWYAFATLLMQSLLFVGPYGGVYRPQKGQQRVSHDARPLERITVFDSSVTYPKPARNYDVLPDDLLQYLTEVFKKDRREEFPEDLLSNLDWQHCSQCGMIHARHVCPGCTHSAPARKTQHITGNMNAERVFRTTGRIVFADYQQGRMHWLYHQDEQYYREDGNAVLKSKLSPRVRYRIHGDSTLLGTTDDVQIVSKDGGSERVSTDHFGQLPIFDTTGEYILWVKQGVLKRSSSLGTQYAETVGTALKDRTLFWTGETTGFGFYHAGRIQRYFVFDTRYHGINERVDLPPIRGQLLDSTAFFYRNNIWFFVSVNQNGNRTNQAYALSSNGELLAQAQATVGDGSWLGTIRGKLAVSDFLLSATDKGIVRVDVSGDQLVVTKDFPDTEQVVDAASHLFPGKDGITVVNRQSIWNLTIS